MNGWQFAGTLLLWAGNFAGLRRCLHMLQQNSYRLRRYAAFGKTAGGARVGAAALFAAAAALLWRFLPPAFPFLAAGMAAVRAGYNRAEQKGAVKPLAVTARVRRQFGAAGLLAAASTALAALPGPAGAAGVAAALCFAAFTPALAVAALWLCAPVEAALRGWYIHDAKRMLKAMPGLTVIGVTGSYGKTTTKFILARLLSERYSVTVTPESYNTPMGVVRTVRERMKPDSEIFVVEMGAKQRGDIREICRIVAPRDGVITAVGPQHLDTFGSLEAVRSTKYELAEAVAKAGGRLFCNADNPAIAEQPPAGAVLYGESPKATVRVTDVRYGPAGAEFTVRVANEVIPLHTRLLGRHAVSDIAAAVAVAVAYGVPAADIQFAVASLTPTPHRLESKPYQKGALLLDDAYNANPEGSLEAVRVLGGFTGKTRVLITPGLVELGEEEERCNRALGECAGQNCDHIVLVGPRRSRPIAEGVLQSGFPPERLQVAASFREAMALVEPLLSPDCVLLLENDLPDNYLY